MKKLYSNNFTVIISSLALSSTLIACSPSKINNEQLKNEITTQLLNQTLNKEKSIVEKGDLLVKKIKERNEDRQIEEYITIFKQEISDLKSTAAEKWNSKETQEKINNIKQKAKDLFDFIFNGKEINGITFNDLSEEEKQITLNGFYELDGYIELLIPNYKERLYDWTVDKGADAKQTYDSLKQWFENYQKDVLEEENARKIKSK